MNKVYLVWLILSSVTVLFLSCNEEDVEIQQSEIVFDIPVKSDTIYDQIVVYPNPFDKEIIVSSFIVSGDSATIQLSDGNGKFLNRETMTDGVWNIDTKDYPAGVYYIEILMGAYVDRAKMLKQYDNQ